MKNKLILCSLLLSASFLSVSGQTVRSIRSIGNDQITVMELGTNGDIWVGTLGAGVKHYIAANQNWATFNTATNPLLKSDTINAIVFGPIGGVLHAFFGTPSGLSFSRNDTVFAIDSLLPAETNVTALAIAPGDTLIAFTANAGAVAFDSTQKRLGKSPVPCTHMSSAQGTQGYSCTTGLMAGSIDSGACYTTDYLNYTILYTPNLVNDSVTAVYLDHGCNARFIGTRDGFSFCPSGQNCQNYTTANGLPENYITSLGQDCRGYVWLGTRDSGVAIFNPMTHTFTRMTTANGLTSNQVTAIAFLADTCKGTGYIGTTDGNIALIDTGYTVQQILSSYTKCD